MNEKRVPVIDRTTNGTIKRGAKGIKAIGAMIVVKLFAKSIL